MKQTSRLIVSIIVFLMLSPPPLLAQKAEGDPGEYVSRAEYEKLKQEFEAFKAEVRKTNQTSATGMNTEEYIAFIDEQLAEVRTLAEASRAGSTKFLITGYGFAGYTDRENDNSSFGAGFNPIFLWELSDRILFEGELELELESEDGAGETHTELEYAHVSFLLNDEVTLGAGKFLTPFGTFSERLHPAWINKLPDAPLPFGHDGLVPSSSIGFYVRGGMPVLQASKMNYAFYLSNGPRLNTEEDDEAGMLHFDNFDDINNSKAIGGRIGFLPFPELELGYSFMVAKVSPVDFEDITAVLHGIDLGYVKEIDALGGTVDVRFEWVWSDVDDAIYDADGALGFGPLTFDNKRQGGYVQVAYRPSKSGHKVIKNLEGVFRYDVLDLPEDAPEAHDEQRYTFGLNYWINPSFVVKFACQFDDKDGGDDQNAFFIQTALGF